MDLKRYVYELMTDQRHKKFDKFMQKILGILSSAYGIIVEITRAMYQEHWLPVYRSPKPVVSIGNITTGGVGKTPMVIWLVKALNEKRVKTVVLSRGYGSSQGLNDETKMFKEILPKEPIITGRDRKKSIRQALAKEPVDIFIADDAFQHWPLHRDLDIVLIDASNPFGNGYLVPRGVLREKKDALVRADIFILTKTNLLSGTKVIHQELRQINSRALIVESQHAPRSFRDIFTGKIHDLNSIKSQKVLAFCAIGDPFSFAQILQQIGSALVSNFTFADHHIYTDDDLKYLVEFAVKENVNILVTTHKDAVKISHFRTFFHGLTVLSLDIDLTITQGKDEIIDRILSLRRN